MIPILRFHKKTGQYYVWISESKSRKYMGADPKLARERYAQFVASIGGPAALPSPSSMTVADAVEAYRRHADAKYTRQSERHRIETALDAVVEMHGRQPVNSFKAKAFRDVRARLLTAGKRPRSRNYVNKIARSIQTAWRWLASEELVTAESASSVCMVRPLANGDGGKERLPVLPPEFLTIDATLGECPPLVRDMLRVQLLTGARPGEICGMRWDEISTAPEQPVPLPGTGRTVSALRCGGTLVWIYAPSSHKTARRGKSRVIAIGPAAQEILTAWMRSDGREVFRTRLGTLYRADSYARAVSRACVRAGVPRWAPNALRHARATDLAEQFDDATAAAVLGHAAGSGASKIYIEQAVRRAAEAAAKVG